MAVDMTIALMTMNASAAAPMANASQSRLSGMKPSTKP